MITIHSLLEVAGDLVPVEEFVGPIRNELYIDGTIELIVDGTSILSRQQVDLVDQLWSYLLQGLTEIIAGREFSTDYPDMPVEILLRPHGDRVRIKVDTGERVAEADVALDELRGAMITAANVFFEHMRPLVPSRRLMYDDALAYIATLAA